jgi:hypothetical protein
LCGSQNKQRLFPYRELTGRFYNWDGVCLLWGMAWILETGSVYCRYGLNPWDGERLLQVEPESLRRRAFTAGTAWILETESVYCRYGLNPWDGECLLRGMDWILETESVYCEVWTESLRRRVFTARYGLNPWDGGRLLQVWPESLRRRVFTARYELNTWAGECLLQVWTEGEGNDKPLLNSKFCLENSLYDHQESKQTRRTATSTTMDWTLNYNSGWY